MFNNYSKMTQYDKNVSHNYIYSIEEVEPKLLKVNRKMVFAIKRRLVDELRKENEIEQKRDITECYINLNKTKNGFDGRLDKYIHHNCNDSDYFLNGIYMNNSKKIKMF